MLALRRFYVRSPIHGGYGIGGWVGVGTGCVGSGDGGDQDVRRQCRLGRQGWTGVDQGGNPRSTASSRQVTAATGPA